MKVPVHCAHDKIVSIGKLKPNPANPNKHPPEQIALLAKIIAAQGWRNPIVVSNRSGLVTKGHARLEVAQRLKLKTAPVDYQDYASETEELADMIADNRIAELAEADRTMLRELAEQLDDGLFDMDLTGFDQDALEELMTATAPESDVDAEPQVDKAEELREKWGVERGQIWELGEHRLMCGDSTKRSNISALMKEERCNLCFTSPPYSDQRSYKLSEDNLSVEYLATFLDAASLIADTFAINLGIKREKGEVVQYWKSYETAAYRNGLKLLSWNIWDKGRGGSIGSMSAMFPIEHEWIFVFGRKPCKLRPTVPNITAGQRTRWRNMSSDGTYGELEHGIKRDFAELGSIFRGRQVNDNHDHPAQFSPQLALAYIASFTGEVLDPFVGSGTTIIACEQLGRKCRAMEIDPGYVAISIQRWADATGKTPKLINGG